MPPRGIYSDVTLPYLTLCSTSSPKSLPLRASHALEEEEGIIYVPHAEQSPPPASFYNLMLPGIKRVPYCLDHHALHTTALQRAH